MLCPKSDSIIIIISWWIVNTFHKKIAEISFTKNYWWLANLLVSRFDNIEYYAISFLAALNITRLSRNTSNAALMPITKRSARHISWGRRCCGRSFLQNWMELWAWSKNMSKSSSQWLSIVLRGKGTENGGHGEVPGDRSQVFRGNRANAHDYARVRRKDCCPRTR